MHQTDGGQPIETRVYNDNQLVAGLFFIKLGPYVQPKLDREHQDIDGVPKPQIRLIFIRFIDFWQYYRLKNLQGLARGQIFESCELLFSATLLDFGFLLIDLFRSYIV